MRLGGHILKPWKTPEEWIALVRELGYSTVIFPVDCTAPKETVREFCSRIADEGLTIGEVGVWRNLMCADEKQREETLMYSVRQLELAEEVGAGCCVNVSGSRGPCWDGFHPDNYSRETFDLIVEQSRRIIDAVKPVRTAYTLEPMPWMLPDGPDSCLELMKAVDRPVFAVHLDFTNMINSLERYMHADRLIDECFDKLGPYIRSVHIKDCVLSDEILPFSISEVPVGKGIMDLARVLRRCEELGEDTTVYTEHLMKHEDYVYSTAYLRELGRACGVGIK